MNFTVAVAGFQHETNTFAPQKAELKTFIEGEGWPGLTEGKAIIEVFSPANIPIGGFVAIAPSLGLKVEPIAWAAAQPCSYVTEEAFEFMAKKIVDGIAALRGRIDAVYLDLHGAMVTEHLEDGEGEILRRVRAAVGPDLPVVASLDLHANVTERMVAEADLLVAYRTYPHLDMARTGARLAKFLARLLKGETARPAKAYRRLPFLMPLTSQCTFIEPCKSLYERLEELEDQHPGLASMSFTPGFHPADIRECGPAVLAYADSQQLADRAADSLTREISEREGEFAARLLSPPAAIEAARKLIQGGTRRPIVLADVQDNAGAGATSDTTGLLEAMVRAGVPDAAIGLLYDPEAALIARQAGEGAEIEIGLGGKLLAGQAPFRAKFKVGKLGDGGFLCTGPFYGGTHMQLGPMALLRIGGVDVAVSSTRVQAADKEMFRHLGVEPVTRQILGLKSTVHFRGDFTDIAHEILTVESPGAFIERAETLPYKRLRPGLRLSPKGQAFKAA